MSIVRLQGCLEIELIHPCKEDIIEAVIQPILYYDEQAYEVDLWSESKFMEGLITTFKAWVIMKWDGRQYSIVEPRRLRACNQFWKDMEIILSDHIMANV